MSGNGSKYWQDMSRLTLDTKVVAAETEDDGRSLVYLEETIAYPQGGGQPSDIATIESETGRIDITFVKADQRGVCHIGKLRHGQLQAGQAVRLSIDPAVRLKHSKLHSAGELICAALRMRGHSWPVVAAVHFPGEAKVVVDANLDENARQNIRTELEVTLRDLIARDLPVHCEVMNDRSRLAELCGYEPDYLPPGEATRLVTILNGFARPCMGTHVARTCEIGRIDIRNVKTKKGCTSIGYDVP